VAWEDLFRSPNSKVEKQSEGRRKSHNTNTHPTSNGKPSTPQKSSKKKTKHAARAVTTSGMPLAKPEEVYRGPPNDEIEGGWPPGWLKTEVKRNSGAYAGARDRYWFSPGGKKLRSMIEVKKFFLALSQVRGDEEAAWRVFRSTKGEKV
jgi:Methyl-CpG binding domain